jgi:leucyl aminopeptidase
LRYCAVVLKITAVAEDPRHVEADVLVVPVFKGGIEGPGVAPLLAAVGLDTFPVTPSFRGDVDQHLLLAAPGLASAAVLLVGLGRMDESDAERLRRAAGCAARAVAPFERVATTLAEVHATPAAVEAVATGFHLGAYADRRFRSAQGRASGASGSGPQTDGGSRLREVVVLTPSSGLDEARGVLERAAVYARAAIAARDLVNTPPDRKRPPDLAAALAELAEGCCEVSVRDETDLARKGFGGILGVGRGSAAPPRLVELRYRPPAPLGHVVLVGKGITFDTGGLSKKTTEQMSEMKSDMAGAAAVAATCSVLRDLGVRLAVTALLPLAENAVGADAQRPDDVLTLYGGTTVEVRDTDAEGRLVLADALAYATTLEPDAIVDLATLTGSAITAVGRYAAAVMGDDELVASLRAAAGVVGEPLWPLPLWPQLEQLLDTPIADVNNTGDGAGGGAIMGGLFLQRFVGDVPWAHLDIAGPAFLPASLAAGYLPAGATGYGVRTLLAWLQRRAE